MEAYKAESVVEVVSVDCRFFDPSFIKAEDKYKWAEEFSAKVLPGYYAKIDKACSENIKRTGFAANNKLSIADVYVLGFLSFTAFHPRRKDQCFKYLEEFPTLVEYWNKHYDKMEYYMKNIQIDAPL